MTMIRTIALVFASAALFTATPRAPAADEAKPASGRKADQAALKAYGPLVGKWKGVGQPKRGNASGSWTEMGDWSWKLSNDAAALELAVDKGKYLKAAELRPGAEPGAFTLKATLADGSTRTFAGKAGDHAKLVLAATESGAEGLGRITLSPLHDTRFLLLLEGRSDSGGLARLGEVGYTRQGIAFATGEAGPICIVTEGRGTIAVKHKGQTYYVCCSGCKELFDEDPDAILAEAKARADAKTRPK